LDFTARSRAISRKPDAYAYAPVARVDAAGKLSQVAVVPTHEGARNGVVTKDGTLYLAHSQLGNLQV
jgi:hypothetical protein